MNFFSKFWRIIAVLLIALFSIFLRVYNLEQIPKGFYVDEATVGYNAFSIAKTEKDEYGKRFPIAFRLFGSYSPPLYIYLTALMIKLWDLNIFSVRILSAISGIIIVLITFVFVRSLTLFDKRISLTFFVSFIFAISPWAIFYSRAGYEVNFAFMVFSLGVLLVWLSFKKPILLVIGLPVLSLSAYAAHTEVFLVPIFIFFYLIVFYKDLFSRKFIKWTLIGLGFALIIQMPYLMIASSAVFNTKYSLFYAKEIEEQVKHLGKFIPFPLSLILALLREFSSRFITYFSPGSLFFLPDPDPQRSFPEMSVFYSWMAIPYLSGFFYVFKFFKKREVKFIVLLSVTTTLPASLTVDPFSTQRNLPLLLPLFLIISLGIVYIYNLISKKRFFWIVAFLLSGFSLVALWRSMIVFWPNEDAKAWGYGVDKLAVQINANQNTKFIIDQGRQKPLYIQLLFFMKYPPDKYHKETYSKIEEDYYSNLKFNQNIRFANVELRDINWRDDIYKDQILVGDELAISEAQAKEHFLSPYFEISDPIKQIVFRGFRTNPAEKCRSIQYNNKHCIYSLESF